jgi:peptidoglycan hydrolase CwlO-like protein
MLEGMTGDLKDARDHEANSVEVFEELKSAKTGEITSQTNSINEKTQELAEAQVNLANDKQNLEDTSADLELDEKFLAELKEKCATFDKQYAERSETRTQELAALSEAQKILSDDDARDAMSGLGKGVQSFIQTGASASARRAAAAVLRQASKGVKDSSILLTLSVATQIDSFGKVKEVLHKMKTKLGDEQKQEIEDKAECTEALNANNEEVQKVTYRRDDLDDKVTTLTAQVETLNEEIKALEQEINEAHVGIKKAGALRVEQSKAFKVAISDNIAAVKILGKVLDRLNEFYAPKTELLTQPEAAYNDGRAGRASSDAPEEFKKEYSGSQRSGGVLAMISKIIDDAEKEHDEMVSDEQTAQADYEQLVSDSFDAIKKSQRSVIDRQEQRAQAESDLTSSKEDLQSTDENLERLDKTGKDYHRQCDYILDHFDEMQKERIIEMEAIDMAVSMLSGMA